MKYFLDEVIKKISSASIAVENMMFILPNKRSGLFLKQRWIEYFQGKTSWLPQIMTIDSFMEAVSGLKQIDHTMLLFEFYRAYKNTHKKEESFDSFLKWGSTILSDLNDIDRSLVEANPFFRYISSVERVEKWQPQELDESALIRQEFIFWKGIEKTYHEIRKNLEQQSFGYQGMIYRKACEQIEDYLATNSFHFVFAGFNALSKAEESIIRYLKTEGRASLFWDADHYYLKDNLQEAGSFLRKKKKWSFYNNEPFIFIGNTLEKQKNIHIIGTPKQVGQAKLTGTLLEQLLDKKEKLTDTALVLADENLLEPVLGALPDQVKEINVTMGYPLTNVPLNSFFSSLLNLYLNVIKFNKKGFYYRDVLEILRSEYIDYLTNEKKQIVKNITRQNQTFIPTSYFKEHRGLKNIFCEKLTLSPEQVIDSFLHIIACLAQAFILKNDKLQIEYLFRFSVLFEQLNTLIKKFNFVSDVNTLQVLYKQILSYETLAFYGEPLQGLQLMGMLETRLLDFKNIIITSVNEAILPKGKTMRSFVPFDIRKQMGMPTFEENDAIFAYHFYRLLQRAENIYLIYNTESDTYGSGEKSRFLTQLEIELPYPIKHSIATTTASQKPVSPIKIEKSSTLINRLKQMAQEGFSPSALNNYIRNPLTFYKQNVLQLDDLDQVEETIGARTLGIIIHNTLRALYSPYLDEVLTVEILKKVEKKLVEVLPYHFRQNYQNANYFEGKNLLTYHVVKHFIEGFLHYEQQQVRKGNQIIIKHLELELKAPFVSNGKTVYLKGIADRIDQVNGLIRIIDYKTGVVDQAKLKIKDFRPVTSDPDYDKALQLLLYAYMYQYHFQTDALTTGILSFRKLKTGTMLLHFNKNTLINSDILNRFRPLLEDLICEILDVNIPIIEKITE